MKGVRISLKLSKALRRVNHKTLSRVLVVIAIKVRTAMPAYYWHFSPSVDDNTLLNRRGRLL